MTSSANALYPEIPAGAYDDFLPDAMVASREQRLWTPADGKLPALFVSHGAPPTLDDPVWLRQLSAWSLSMPKPRAIVVVSAHWENAPLAISATDPNVPLYYDFGGFHPRYYTLQYRTPDATALAHEVVGTLSPTEPMHHFANRGLDHGAFIPLMAMYPLADVPVIQVSMPSQNPQELFALGQRLAALRSAGILVIGSGFATHFMGLFQMDPSTWDRMTPFNADFDAWEADALSRGDVDALLNFRAKGPGNALAHRTSDHFVPILLALGAADDVHSVRWGVEGVSLTNSKRSFSVD